MKLACETLHACSGCEISMLDMGEKLFELFRFADIVHLPLLMDSKYNTDAETEDGLMLPKADIGLISGGVKTKEHISIARAMRKACGTIVAIGTCATHGGIPAMANAATNEQLKTDYFGLENQTADDFFSGRVPKLLDTCKALDEVITVDARLPGCPPHPDHIFKLLCDFNKGERYQLPEKSVCDSCPAQRAGKGRVKQIKRMTALPELSDHSSRDEKKGLVCFLDIGLLCMGPVTQNGCGGDLDGPKCIGAGVPCKGCYGPVPHDSNPKLAMLNALVSNGIDIQSLPETLSLLRFSGAHGSIKPANSNRDKEK